MISTKAIDPGIDLRLPDKQAGIGFGAGLDDPLSLPQAPAFSVRLGLAARRPVVPG
ncbi:MAG TPA: hypothetical protein VHU42_18615 [Rhodopila sp.]|nr:hypothetical protein [Rhodopila sp.]